MKIKDTMNFSIGSYQLQERSSLSARYSYSYAKKITEINEDTKFFETQTDQSSTMNNLNHMSYHYGSFGAVYDLSENSEVGAEIEYSTNSNRSEGESITNMKDHTLSSNIKNTINTSSNANFIYISAFYKIKTDTLGSTFKVIGDYMNNDNASNLSSDAQYDAAFDNLRNYYTQSIPSGVENTDLNSYSKTADEGGSQNYTDFFPSVSISRNLGKDKNHMIALNYSRRISRPYFSYFNPFSTPLSEFSVIIGNPDIRPTYINRYSATAVLYGKYSIPAEYTNYKGVIQQMVYTDPDKPNSVIYQRRNMDNQNIYSISASAPIKLSKWWSMNVSFFANYNELSFGDTEKSQLTAMLSSHNTIDFGKGWKGELFAFGITPQISANMEIKSIAVMYTGLTKTAFKNKVTFSAYIRDVFKSGNSRINFSERGYSKNITEFTDNQSFSLGVRYNFSAGKSVKVKSVETSDREERGRM